MLAVCWNYPPDLELSCKWAVLVLDVCCMASRSFLFGAWSLNPCALLMMNQVWVLLGGESGIVKCFPWWGRGAGTLLSGFFFSVLARTRGSLSSPLVNSPSKKSSETPFSPVGKWNGSQLNLCCYVMLTLKHSNRNTLLLRSIHCSVMTASNNISPSHSNPSFQRVSWSGASTDTIKRVLLDLSWQLWHKSVDQQPSLLLLY